MIFTGKGVVWNPKKNKPLVNFKLTPEYETTDGYEIKLLEAANNVDKISIPKPQKEESVVEAQPEEKPMTKNEVMESLDASGIDYNPRDKKEVLLKLLEG